MANISIDESLCTGCGLCASMCPEKFEVGDDNVAHVKGGSCDCDINEAASSCPMEAIKIED
ncbi:MAG: ferredoxin [Candidatus Omnitrophica bacterium]|jgi:ferredoxin|nr:ferredoxin [Candidatus Omnitrophota bacterium]